MVACVARIRSKLLRLVSRTEGGNFRSRKPVCVHSHPYKVPGCMRAYAQVLRPDRYTSTEQEREVALYPLRGAEPRSEVDWGGLSPRLLLPQKDARANGGGLSFLSTLIQVGY